MANESITKHDPPTPHRVRSLMYYDNGKLFAIKPRGGSDFGSELGTFVKKHGRYKIQINGKKYYRARVVWCYHKGEWPADTLVIDHINRDCLDDRIENLRAITQEANMRNKNAAWHNESGRAGVSKAPDGRWRANIQVGKKTKNLGTYVDLEDAITAREVAEKELW